MQRIDDCTDIRLALALLGRTNVEEILTVKTANSFTDLVPPFPS
jgi:hypothetical protein